MLPYWRITNKHNKSWAMPMQRTMNAGPTVKQQSDGRRIDLIYLKPSSVYKTGT